MSRAYRIKVKESLRRVLRAHDRVSTQLELLEVLPRPQMAQLLRDELKQRGFEEKDGSLVRRQKGLTIAIDPATGSLSVESEAAREAALQAETQGHGYEDFGPNRSELDRELRIHLRRSLEKQADQQAAELQSQVTDQLERELRDLRPELDQAVNRVIGSALKLKAAQLGQIKELTEDPQTGSLTIVVEV